MNKKIVSISHTHWDREWYLTKESFSMMLIELVDRVLSILQKDEEYVCFMLDGQTIVLEDYLNFRPERRDEISQLVRRGKLIIGPWYILPDEYLISGEGHIRNYLVGQRICASFGGSMQHGYLPDSFGHPSQIPQILLGLGLTDAIFWRGLGKDITKTEFYWEGVDGSRVLAINMPYSYGIGACLPEDSKTLKKRFTTAIERLEPLTCGNVLLLMQGVDHVAPDPQLPEKLKTVSRSLPDYDLIQGSLDTYMEMIDRSHITETARGELRSGYRAYLLGGTLSTRGYLKQKAFETERSLVAYAEPLAVLAHLYGGAPVPTERLRRAWTLYLENMPHDSICGCSIDEVHQEMMLRFRDLETVNRNVIEESVATLQNVIGISSDDRQGFCLFNPLPFKREETVTVSIPYEEHLLRQVDYMTGELVEYEPVFSKPIPGGVVVEGPEGTRIRGVVTDVRQEDRMDLSLDRQPVMYRVRMVTIKCTISGILPLSFAAYRCSWKGAEKIDVSEVSEGGLAVLENSYCRISVDEKTAEIILYDKRLDRTIEDLFYYQDGGDAGDEYTYSPPPEDTIIRSHVTKVAASEGGLILTSKLMIPESLKADRNGRSQSLLEHHIETVISLEHESDLIKITTRLENKAKDHRLRLVTAGCVQSGRSWAEGLFSIDTREPIGREEEYSSWVEPPGTFFQKRFAALADSEMAIIVLNEGLHEYEVIRGEWGFGLAVTLLRSVGWLSRADLLARNGNGGWSLETPGAQAPGPAEFHCALQIRSSLEYEQLMRSVREYSTPSICFPLPSAKRSCQAISALEFGSDTMVLSALKPAEEGPGFILRWTNYDDREAKQKVKFNFPVESVIRTDLAERAFGPLEVADNAVSADSAPWAITTLSVCPEEGAYYD
jgi:alpha-mannosidase